MPICQKCQSAFPNFVEIEGKTRNLHRRKLCLDCSPWKGHNTRSLVSFEKKQQGLYLCSMCKQYLPRDQFYWSAKGHRNCYCKKCHISRTLGTKSPRPRLKRKAVAVLGGQCQVCGYSKAISAMHFHHLDPSLKKFNLTDAHNHPWADVLEELKHCVLLCNRCHSEVHEGLVKLDPTIGGLK